MYHFLDKYINPFTDYGFKKLFGEEPNKDLLLDFLNELLREEQGTITSLTYIKNEHLGTGELDRKAIFDLYCENERGEKFIVELQKTKQNFFKDRTVYYATFPIRDQVQRGPWDYELKAVYAIAILDFIFEEDQDEPQKYRYDVKLTDIDTCKVFYDKLTFIYLEMPKFNKTLDELETRFDKWLYILRNLDRIETIPEILQEEIFERLFEVAEIARFTPQQVKFYEDSLKYYRDMQNSLDTAKQEGVEEGIQQGLQQGIQQGIQQGLQQGIQQGIQQGLQQGLQQGIQQGVKQSMRQVAIQGLQRGLSDEVLVELTGLTLAEIGELRAELS